MKKISIFLILLLSMTISVGLTSCAPDDGPTEQPPPTPNPNPNPQPPATGNKMQITAGSSFFIATLADNATATAFKEFLPMTVNMTEHGGNEKYYDLSQSITSNHTNPGTIQNGDLMLYSSRTLVLFYKTFSTSYSYTRIGSVDNPSGLQTALGAGSVTVTFELTP
ncbi:MAG: hypothetical protein LUH22_17360 [Bacteroides sp.]|nr:hypothetical protein [Bacteroides sp.]